MSHLTKIYPTQYIWRFKRLKKLKIMTVVGTRPEIIRLSAVINNFNSCEMVEHILVHTGQNYDYELNEIFFCDFKINKPNYFLNSATGTAISTIGAILTNIVPIIEKERPDAFLVLGDTNSCLAAIAAKRYQIPIFHMEAGNRCFDQRVPEEINRKIVDHIADINLPYSTISREYLIKEGFPADRIIKTGSPMFEVLSKMRDQIDSSNILLQLNLKKNNYFLVSFHREENINTRNFEELIKTINAIANLYNLPIIISTHPRTQKMIDTKQVQFHPLIQKLKPLSFLDYNKLQMNAKVVLSDSGTISEESSILKFKALNIRDTHERPEAMEEAAVMMVGVNEERVITALNILINDNNIYNEVKDYQIQNVSEKVLKIIVSYTGYVNNYLWKK